MSSCWHSGASSITAFSEPPRSTCTATSTPASSDNDIASLCNEVLVVTAHEPRRFVERVDFVTSPGHLGGGDAREKAGLISSGPSTVVTDLALLDFEPESRRMRLRALQPGVTVEDVRARTGFELLVHPELSELPPPDEEELRILRELAGGAAGGD
jgi:glutaconate CoA-transferase, subunit B